MPQRYTPTRTFCFSVIGAGFSGSVGSGPVPVPGSGAGVGRGLIVSVPPVFGSFGFGSSTFATYTGFFHWA